MNQYLKEILFKIYIKISNVFNIIIKVNTTLSPEI